MIPEVSSTPIIGDILQPNNSLKLPLSDWEMGGVALGNPSQGNNVKPWKASYNSSTGEISLEAFDVPATVVYTQLGITWLSFCFDQNMKFLFAFTSTPGTIGTLRWYDPAPAAYVNTSFGTNVRTPHITMDEKVELSSATNDVILTYVDGSDIFLRVQRERFLDAHLVGSGLSPGQKIKNFGMSTVNRLQWEIQ